MHDDRTRTIDLWQAMYDVRVRAEVPVRLYRTLQRTNLIRMQKMLLDYEFILLTARRSL